MPASHRRRSRRLPGALAAVVGGAVAAAVVTSAVAIGSGIVALPAVSAQAPPAATHNPTLGTHQPAPSAAPLSVVSLGDSVPAAARCGCAGFPAYYAAALSHRDGLPVAAHNLAVSGQTSGGLAAMLRTSTPTRAALSRADVVTITIGANDVSYDGPSCTDTGCYAAALAHVRAGVDETLTAVSRLVTPRHATVLVTGYWEIWKDGAVGRRSGATYMHVGDALTRRVNAIVARLAAAHAMTYVDIYRPFRGAHGDHDDTALLAADGDHPSAAGHHVIASALLAATPAYR